MSEILNDRRINEALLFAARWMIDSCHNTGKPVYLHSLRVAETIKNLGYDEDTIIAAILHDLIEDTDCTLGSIEEAFGFDITQMVHALSYDESISDRLEKNIDSINRCAVHGVKTLAIKCVDVSDNCRFYSKADPETKKYLLEKYKYLAHLCEKFQPQDRAYQFLLDQLRLHIPEHIF